MNNKTPISVLMSVYNAEIFIRESIQSVLDQTFRDFEFVIVNDGSTDLTGDIIKSFSDPRIVYLEQSNKGIASALNEGLKIAKGIYIARFDADDICYHNRLEKQYLFMNQNPSYVIAGSGADYIDKDGDFIFSYTPPALTDDEIRVIKTKICPFIHSTVFYNKQLIIDQGGYNEYAHSFEDHLLWLAVTRHGKAINFPEPLIKVRLNPDSITIDEKWRTNTFHQIKRTVLESEKIDAVQGEQLSRIIKKQNTKKIKLGAYHALVAKKFLWNNYQPVKARESLLKAISLHRLHVNSYCLFCISFLPAVFLKQSYQLLKSGTFAFRKTSK
ncbi:MAG TPA: glycosyltransferase [Flavitalea sp.]|nr:glycosyltransferase [Flavitalea sp.]